MVAGAASHEYPAVTRLRKSFLSSINLDYDHRFLTDCDLPDLVAAHVVHVYGRYSLYLLFRTLIQLAADDAAVVVDSYE